MQNNSIKDRIKKLPNGVKRAIRLPIVAPLRAYVRYFPSTFLKKILWNSVISHVSWLESTVDIESVFGAKFAVDPHDTLGRYLYYFGIWEPNLTHWIKSRLQAGDMFIDIGANIGYFSILAGKIVGTTGKVVSIEALPEIFQQLKTNVKSNGVENIRSVNTAAWHREEKLKFFARADNPTGTTTAMQEWADRWSLTQEFEVSAQPLAVILTNDEIKNARLIKIDVEGAEWHVVSEMRSWLPSCRQDVEIILEITCSMLKAHGKSGQDLFDVFSELGFNAYQIVNDYDAASYIDRAKPLSPKRLNGFPNTGDDQYDIIFSRSNTPFI